MSQLFVACLRKPVFCIKSSADKNSNKPLCPFPIGYIYSGSIFMIVIFINGCVCVRIFFCANDLYCYLCNILPIWRRNDPSINVDNF